MDTGAWVALGGVVGAISGAFLKTFADIAVARIRKGSSTESTRDTGVIGLFPKVWEQKDEWQNKYYEAYKSLSRLENVVDMYMKLQVKYGRALLDLARCEAKEKARQDIAKSQTPKAASQIGGPDGENSCGG